MLVTYELLDVYFWSIYFYSQLCFYEFVKCVYIYSYFFFTISAQLHCYLISSIKFFSKAIMFVIGPLTHGFLHGNKLPSQEVNPLGGVGVCSHWYFINVRLFFSLFNSFVGIFHCLCHRWLVHTSIFFIFNWTIISSFTTTS